MKKFDLERYCPLGYNFSSEKNVFLSLATVSIIYSLLFYIRYFDFRSRLYTYRSGKRVLIEGRMMEEFHNLTDGIFYGFFVVIFVCLCFIILRYAYHYQGTKSIYTMRRLPKKSELHIRCIVLPLMLIFSLILVMLLVLLLDLAVYFIFTPKQCLYPFSIKSFWRALI